MEHAKKQLSSLKQTKITSFSHDKCITSTVSEVFELQYIIHSLIFA